MLVRVCSPTPLLDPVRREIAAACSALADVVSSRRLSADPEAWEWSLAGGTSRVEVREAVRAVAPGLDVCVLPADSAVGPRLVVLDVDSTLIEQEVIELIADHAGSRAEVQAVTEAAMRGELDFAQSLRARVATLAGLPVHVLTDVRDAVRPHPGAATLVAALHAHGHTVGAVSGGFHEILDPLAASLGLDHARANRLEVVDGRLTGRVTGPLIDRAAKEDALRRWCEQDGVHLRDAVAVGDGANDLDMLGAAGVGIAFCAKPAVREAADTTISFPRLDAVLHHLGYTGDEVEAALAGTGIRRGD